MFGSAIIVFRETLEAALIVSIIAAATVGLAARTRWLATGLLAGCAGSVLIALLTERIAGMADGMGHELFNAGVLGIAVLMLAWHNIWMARHGRVMAGAARQLGHDVRHGERTMPVLAAVIALAVLREGAETALFLYGMTLDDSTSLSDVLGGGLLGLGAGALAGWGLYAGFVRIPIRFFLSVTSALVLLLAAAMASNMVRFLVAADLLPALADPLWDSSAWLDQNSPQGVVLHLLMGYEAQPLGMQVLAYGITLSAILAGMARIRMRDITAPALSKAVASTS